MTMALEVAAAIVGASSALIGAGIGGGVNLWVESRRSAEAARLAHRSDLLKTCSEFTGAVARARSLCYQVRSEVDGSIDSDVDGAIVEAIGASRVECERLRLLLDGKESQQAARLALRHIYAVWKLARDGVDPRRDRYPGSSPQDRLRSALTQLYVGVRAETGSKHPADVFEDLDD